MAFLGDEDQPANVGDIVGNVLDTKPLALRLAAPSQFDNTS